MAAHVTRTDVEATDRQIEYLIAFIEEGSSKVAAHRLGIGDPTLKNILVTTRKRLGSETTTQAILRLVATGRVTVRIDESNNVRLEVVPA